MHSFHERLHEESRLLREKAVHTRREHETLLADTLAKALGTSGENAKASILEVLTGNRPDVPTPGLVRSTETEVVDPALSGITTERLRLNGNAYLKKLGFAGNLAGLYESCFMVEGSVNLDTLETLVRDVLGIYGGTHGKHLREFSQYSYAVYNLLREGGSLPFASVTDGVTEATWYFSKPGPETIKYSAFRTSLFGIVGSLENRFDGICSSLWQRKLGLGLGDEFFLRIYLREGERLKELTSWLETQQVNPVVHTALLVQGSLVIRNVSYARSAGING